MAKEVLTPQEEMLENAQTQTENFFEKNSKMVVVAIVVIFAIAAAIFGYKKFVREPLLNKAQEMLYEAQYRFEQQNADYALALNGDENAPGFAAVAEQYANTPAGNLAQIYAAACALRLGELEQAEAYVAKYSKVKGLAGAMINAMAEGIKGDIAVEKGDYAAAAKNFEAAANTSDNDFTAPMYWRKAAQAYRKVGDNASSDKCLNVIKNKYPGSSDAREAEKFIN